MNMSVFINFICLAYFNHLDMVYDNDPLICKFFSIPKEFQNLNCAVFYGGMIEAILTANGYVTPPIFK